MSERTVRGDAAERPAAAAFACSEEWDRRLARAACAFGGEPGLGGMLDALNQALGGAPGFLSAGLGLYDARRNVVVLYRRDAGGSPESGASSDGPKEGEEFPADEAEFDRFRIEPSTWLSPELTEAASGVAARLRLDGARRCTATPLSSGGQIVGILYAAFGGPPTTPDVVAFVDRLGRALTPAFINYRTQTRLAKGDQRRITLIQLSHAINTSLQFEEVLASAMQAVSGLEGYRACGVLMLDEGRGEVRGYWADRTTPDVRAAVRTPTPRPIDHTLLARIRKQEKTYESDDLHDRRASAMDEAMHAAGARRYVASPMFVRGRIIGAFIFGTADPQAALTTDTWLYENIALQLGLAIDNALQFAKLRELSDRLAQQNVYLREEINTEHNLEGMIGRSAAIKRVFEAVERVAPTMSTVLIVGETGVGKELVARAIHARSERAHHPLIKINCAAIPEGLVESELFGHERGAFTSATARRIGRFELANEGTLFLDEVGELPPGIQAKLLRVLQDGEFERVGGTETLTTNVRIIAATNRDLSRAVDARSFRSDLYYRLNVFPIHVPPLSERRDDVPLLVEAFIAQFNRRMGKSVRAIDPDALAQLCERPWLGNVRELRSVIERSMILCDGERLTIDSPAGPTGPVRNAPSGVESAPPVAPATTSELPPTTLESVEREHIRGVLERARWIVEGPRGAAVLLGMKPSTLRFRMKRLGIRRP